MKPGSRRAEHPLSRAFAWQTARMMRLADRVEAGDAARVTQADIDRVFSDARAMAARVASTRR